MRRKTINAVALLLASAGFLILGWQAVEFLSAGGDFALFFPASTPQNPARPTPTERSTSTPSSTPASPLPRTLEPSDGISPAPTLFPSRTGTATPTVTPSSTATAPATSTRRSLAVSPAVTLIPTHTPTAAPMAPPSPTPPDPIIAPTIITASPTAIVASATPTQPPVVPSGSRWRFGVVDRLGDLSTYDLAALNAGWILTGLGSSWVPPGTELARTVWVQAGGFSPDAETLATLAALQPGTMWQVGNEPDCVYQANSTPEQYARVYHEVYTAIKSGDPTARVAAGAVSQPTPLRLQYLDLVLQAYQNLYGQTMPVDIWSVHNSILREERGSWGVDIPPGIAAGSGRLYEIEDNDRLDIFRQQLIDFRVWMRDRGYRERPLFLTEFSILMPPDFGFPPDRVVAFMTGAFDFLLSAADGALGYPADGNRLVQRWVWYSIADGGDQEHYTAGNLFDPQTKQMTIVGRAFADYVATH